MNRRLGLAEVIKLRRNDYIYWQGYTYMLVENITHLTGQGHDHIMQDRPAENARLCNISAWIKTLMCLQAVKKIQKATQDIHLMTIF